MITDREAANVICRAVEVWGLPPDWRPINVRYGDLIVSAYVRRAKGGEVEMWALQAFDNKVPAETRFPWRVDVTIGHPVDPAKAGWTPADDTAFQEWMER